MYPPSTPQKQKHKQTTTTTTKKKTKKTIQISLCSNQFGQNLPIHSPGFISCPPTNQPSEAARRILSLSSDPAIPLIKSFSSCLPSLVPNLNSFPLPVRSGPSWSLQGTLYSRPAHPQWPLRAILQFDLPNPWATPSLCTSSPLSLETHSPRSWHGHLLILLIGATRHHPRVASFLNPFHSFTVWPLTRM